LVTVAGLAARPVPYTDSGYRIVITGACMDTYETRTALDLPTVAATRYVAPLREGGSLPALIETDNDGLYVVKLRGAAQGAKTLIAELIAGEIGRRLGLRVPDLAIVTLDADLHRAEPDPEIRIPLSRSTGPNLGLDFLPGSLPFDVAMKQPVDPVLAADIVWFDAYLANVDRTTRNPNMLRWHGNLWLIDHGAAIYPHHHWTNPREQARRSFPQIAEHVLLPVAGSLVEADQRLAPRLDRDTLWEAIAAIPEEWFDPADGQAEEQRERYLTWLTARLEAPRPFIAEAERLRLDADAGAIDPNRATRGRRRE